MKDLPQTGTAGLLEALSPHLDDQFISDLLPGSSGRGPRYKFSSVQLFRVLLLGLLTPAHSFNLLVKLLPENRLWRRFAHLPNRREVPDAKMLHLFRERLELWRLRQLNLHLLRPLLESRDPNRMMLTIMDSTDLEAALNTFKKRRPLCPPNTRRWVPARSRLAKANGLWVTKNIRSGGGCRSGRKPSCWSP